LREEARRSLDWRRTTATNLIISLLLYLKAAETLGLTISQSLLVTADVE
jgi:hypothetical protein